MKRSLLPIILTVLAPILVGASSVPGLGDYSDVTLPGSLQTAVNLDGGNVTWYDTTGAGQDPQRLFQGNFSASEASSYAAASKQEVPCSSLASMASGNSRIAVIVVFGQSQAANSPISVQSLGNTRFDSSAPVYQVNPFDGKCYLAQHDPLLGTSGVGGSIWTRLGNYLIGSGRYDGVVFVPLAVGGSSIESWAPGGRYNTKLLVGLRRLYDIGVAPTHIVWSQGAANRSMDSATYKSIFQQIVGQLRGRGTTAPIYISQEQYCYGGTPTDTQFEEQFKAGAGVRTAQRELVNGSTILAGPDGDVIDNSLQNRPDNCHYSASAMDKLALEWMHIFVGMPVCWVSVYPKRFVAGTISQLYFDWSASPLVSGAISPFPGTVAAFGNGYTGVVPSTGTTFTGVFGNAQCSTSIVVDPAPTSAIPLQNPSGSTTAQTNTPTTISSTTQSVSTQIQTTPSNSNQATHTQLPQVIRNQATSGPHTTQSVSTQIQTTPSNSNQATSTQLVRVTGSQSTSGSNTASLLQQIAELKAALDSLRTLQVQRTIPSVSVVYPPTLGESTQNAHCPLITRTLSRGMRGSDVTALQKFLAVQYSDFTLDYVTGFFGPTTEAALRQWQREKKIISSSSLSTAGWGVAGPRTRAAITASCN